MRRRNKRITSRDNASKTNANGHGTGVKTGRMRMRNFAIIFIYFNQEKCVECTRVKRDQRIGKQARKWNEEIVYAFEMVHKCEGCFAERKKMNSLFNRTLTCPNNEHHSWLLVHSLFALSSFISSFLPVNIFNAFTTLFAPRLCSKATKKRTEKTQRIAFII